MQPCVALGKLDQGEQISKDLISLIHRARARGTPLPPPPPPPPPTPNPQGDNQNVTLELSLFSNSSSLAQVFPPRWCIQTLKSLGRLNFALVSRFCQSLFKSLFTSLPRGQCPPPPPQHFLFFLVLFSLGLISPLNKVPLNIQCQHVSWEWPLLAV